MSSPKLGESVFVRPTNPAVRVQRGAGLYGQFLAPAGQLVRWDEFLERRMHEGALELVAPPKPQPQPAEPQPAEPQPAAPSEEPR